MTAQFEPVSSDERLRTLDVLRGAALLGILLMNILTFALPVEAYANPNLWGGNDRLNLGVFAVQWVLFEGKMRALFSMMFGAGIVLFMQRAVERENTVRAADLYNRRMLWLMLFGTLHGWLIWYGDILYIYGLCGLLLFPLRNLPPRKLIVIAASALLLLSLAAVGQGFNLRSTRNDSLAARAAEAQGRTLTKEQQEAKREWDEEYNDALPSRQKMQEEIDAYRNGYFSQFGQRAGVVEEFTFIPVYFPLLFDIWAPMLIGMALFKLGVLQGERSSSFYVRLAIAGYAIGIPVNALSTYGFLSTNFDIVATWFWNSPYEIGRVAVAVAHAAVLVWLVKHARLSWLTDRLAAVGQMAFSNYLSHSVICALIFYAPGLALMGRFQRYQLYGFVLAIWIANLLWSAWWLGRFRFGPLEWCWRSLTYWKRQPMRRTTPAIQTDVYATP